MSASAIDRERLARVLGMLGSDHDGEVLTAARRAERMRHEARLTWADIVRPALPPPGPRRERYLDDLDDVIAMAGDYADAITAWEREFLASMRHWRGALSDKQTAIIDRIVAKLRRAERGTP